MKLSLSKDWFEKNKYILLDIELEQKIDGGWVEVLSRNPSKNQKGCLVEYDADMESCIRKFGNKEYFHVTDKYGNVI